jgi:hypothetical protein
MTVTVAMPLMLFTMSVAVIVWSPSVKSVTPAGNATTPASAMLNV